MQLQIARTEVGFGTAGPDVAQVHQAVRALGKVVPAAEATSRLLGPGTVAVLNALQFEFGVPATGMVDAATVEAINARLAELPTATRVVRGAVRDADGRPFTAGVVEIFLQTSGSERALGRAPLDTKDGSYTISYKAPAESQGVFDLRIAVLNDTGVFETTPSGESILTHAGMLEVVNFVLSGSSHQASSEFDRLLQEMAPFLGGRALADLVEDGKRHDVSLLRRRAASARK